MSSSAHEHHSRKDHMLVVTNRKIMDKTAVRRVHAESAEDCAICLDKIQKKKTLKCLHSFCSECIDTVFSRKPACPICNTFHGVYTGTQPSGSMTVTRSWQNLPGYEHCGCIIIQYSFPAGIQGVRLVVLIHITVLCQCAVCFHCSEAHVCPPEDSVAFFITCESPARSR